MKTREQKEMDALAKLGAIEIGERRGRGIDTQHCVYVNRANRTIGSVTTAEWRDGKTIASSMRSLEHWLKLGAPW